jgi:ORMDL family
MAQSKSRPGRDRSGSLVKVEPVGEGSLEQDLDQGAYVNINSEWVNRKGTRRRHITVTISIQSQPTLGAWILHPVLVFSGKIIIDTIPGMTPQVSWTVVNLCYLLVCCLCSNISGLETNYLPDFISSIPLGDRYTFS